MKILPTLFGSKKAPRTLRFGNLKILQTSTNFKHINRSKVIVLNNQLNSKKTFNLIFCLGINSRRIFNKDFLTERESLKCEVLKLNSQISKNLD
jgi:hypothetical protein